MAIAHEFEFVLLPAKNRLLEEHFGRRTGLQASPRDPKQIRFVVCDTRASATHRERRPHHHRVTEIRDSCQALNHRVTDGRTCALAANCCDDLLELLAILPALDRVDIRPDEFDAVFRQRAIRV